MACPTCRGLITLTNSLEREGAVVKADIDCANCGVVGLINAYRPSYLARDRNDPGALPGVVPEWVPLSLDALAHGGDWRPVHEGLLGVTAGAQLGGLINGSGIRFELLTHRWSGRVKLELGGESRVVDLRSDEVDTAVVVMAGLEDAEHVWSLSLVDGGSSGGTEQVVLKGIFQYVDAATAQPFEWIAENFGNPYPRRFDEILGELPEDAAILDLGGGDRWHPDSRVLNLEYLPYRRVDLYADGLQLPFADDSFDFIMSQAVLEHVPDPVKAVSEMKRVLKPGARIYAEFAFMQPLHAVPFHFYNITPHGAKLLFGDWSNLQIGSFGGLGDTMRWFFRLVGAEEKIGHERATEVVDRLDELDTKMSGEELAMLSSGVFVEATVPSAD
jgi:SAM-dependent methyltransferase